MECLIGLIGTLWLKSSQRLANDSYKIFMNDLNIFGKGYRLPKIVLKTESASEHDKECICPY